MHSDPYRTARWRALTTAVGACLILGGCGGAPEVTLPADKEEGAALCYGAALAIAQAQDETTAISIDQAGHALHFVLLGGSLNGVAEPTKVDQIGARGKEAQHRFVTEKTAAGYTSSCAKAFPETQAGAFKGLPADSPDTRMMCYTLSTALLQIFAQSQIAPDPRAEAYVRLNDQLDQSTLAELQAAGDINPAELAGRAMRGLAQAVRLGSPVDVMKACGDRYLKD